MYQEAIGLFQRGVSSVLGIPEMENENRRDDVDTQWKIAALKIRDFRVSKYIPAAGARCPIIGRVATHAGEGMRAGDNHTDVM